MYKQTLCVTLPISAAVIIAAALFANAGDLNPPEGPIGPTMHTLEEIYELAVAQQPCPSCTWEYSYDALSGEGSVVQAVSGAGILHGLWLKPSLNTVGVKVYDGPIENGDLIGWFAIWENGINYMYSSQFFLLDVAFENGIYVEATCCSSAIFTLLYR